MSYVTITDVKIDNNVAPFLANFEFEITLECIAELNDDLEFKVIYVTDAANKTKDQVLESVSVGPIPVGINRFVLEVPPPNPSLIPPMDILGCTVVSLVVSYMECEFVRIGYLVNIEYNDPDLMENPPTSPQVDQLVRNILADKPRVTRFHLNWENPKDKYYSMDVDTDPSTSTMDENITNDSTTTNSLVPMDNSAMTVSNTFPGFSPNPSSIDQTSQPTISAL